MWLNVAAAEVPGFYGWISSGAKLIGLVLSLLKLENIRFNQIISALQLPTPASQVGRDLGHLAQLAPN